MIGLTPERALIFRITHIENVPWMLDHGLHCRNSEECDPNYREIGNPDLIAKRTQREVPIPPGGHLSDYVPFYFTPHSPMLYNIKTGYGGIRQVPMSEIAILVAALRKLAEARIPFVFTDRHAYLAAARFSGDLADLEWIDWPLLQARDFQRKPDDPEKIERYQAEALIHRHLPALALSGIVCYGVEQKSALEAEGARRGLSLRVEARPDWFFG